MTRGQITVGTLIAQASAGGWNAEPWRHRAVPPPPPPPPAILANSLSLFDIANRWHHIPPRDWIMRPILVAKHYSMLVATGASGKSAVAITAALALVTGRYDLLELSVDRPCRVIVINGEDGSEELTRRIRATCLHFGISLPDIAGRLCVIGARDVPGLTFNRAERGGVVANDAGLDLLQQMIETVGADVVIVDPLLAFCPGGINDGPSASAVAGRLTEMCVKASCAMLLVHHVSKGALRDGDNDPTASMGSIMWTNHARSVWNARRPTAEEAQGVGQPPSAVKDLLMLLHSKANLSRAEDAIFMQMVSVELPNASPPAHPRGDFVGVARRLQVGTVMGLFPPATIKAVLDAIASGTSGGLPYKPTGRTGAQNYKLDVAEILRANFPNDTLASREKLAKQLIERLLEQGPLVKGSVILPRRGNGKGGGKTEEALLVEWAATQWASPPGTGPYTTRTGAPGGTSP